MSEDIIIHFLDAGIPTLGVIIAAFLGGRKLNEIHVLVNKRLNDALDEIAELKRLLRKSEDKNNAK